MLVVRDVAVDLFKHRQHAVDRYVIGGVQAEGPAFRHQVAHDTQEYFRDVHDHLARINGTLDSIRDTISTAIQVNLSMVAIDESEVNKQLAAWAAIFAVFTAFAGIWGMNFKYMPELDWYYGYPAAVAVMCGACGYMYYLFKRNTHACSCTARQAVPPRGPAKADPR